MMGWFTNLGVVMACAAAGLVLYPVQLTEIVQEKKDEQAAVGMSGIIRLMHLVCFSTALGTSLWASFIGGIIMFK